MKHRKIIGIMACDPQGVIGNKGQIPWSYPKEFEYFYQTVKNNIIVMGRKTFNSIPPRILKDCINIVFSRNIKTMSKNNIFFIESLDEFWKIVNLFTDKKIFMIGGAEIAALFLNQNLISEFLLTKINKNYDGDIFFSIDLLIGWHGVIIDKTTNYQIYKFTKRR